MPQELNRPQSTVIVLSYGADPFSVGTAAQFAHAAWFAALSRGHMPACGG
jgi:hypothetical protein